MIDFKPKDFSDIVFFIAIVVLILVSILMIIFVSSKYAFIYQMNKISSESNIILSQ